MRHRKSGRHFSRTAAHRNSMLDTLATQLLDHEAIQTTEAKAKELRSVVEKLITLAKVDTVHTRRLAASRLNQRAVNRNLVGAELVAELKTANSVLNKLFDDIGHGTKVDGEYKAQNFARFHIMRIRIDIADRFDIDRFIANALCYFLS